jgi:hypothetical protein
MVSLAAMSLVPVSLVSGASCYAAPPPLAAPITPGAVSASPEQAGDADRSGFSLRPFLSNVLDSRSDVVAVDTGAPGGGSYVEHIPQAAGLTLRAPL